MPLGDVHRAFGLVLKTLKGPSAVLNNLVFFPVRTSLNSRLETTTRMQSGRALYHGVHFGWPSRAESSTARAGNRHLVNTLALGQQRGFCTAKATDGQIDASGEADDLATALELNAGEIREVKQKLTDVAAKIEEVAAKIDEVEQRSQTESRADEKQYLRDEKSQLRNEKSQLQDEKNKLQDEKNKLLDKEKELRRAKNTVPAGSVDIITLRGAVTFTGMKQSVHHVWDSMDEVEFEEIGDVRGNGSAGGTDGSKVGVHSSDQSVTVSDGLPSSGRMLLMKLPSSLMYMEGDEGGSDEAPLAVRNNRLVIRSEAIKAAEVALMYLQRGWTKKLAVIGIPGIGKSLLSNYLLKLCWEEDVPVIVHDLKKNAMRLLRRGEPTLYVNVNEHERLFEAYAGQRVLYLCDTGAGTILQPHLPDGFTGVTVLTTSPDRKHFLQWGKRDLRYLWLPPWSEAELRVALPHLLLDPSEANIAEVMKRYEVVGGTLRQLTTSKSSYLGYVGETNTAASGKVLGPVQLLHIVKVAKGPVSDPAYFARDVSHKLLHVWPSPIEQTVVDTGSLLQTLSVEFPSDFVRDAVIQSWDSSAAGVVAEWIEEMSKVTATSGSSGTLYERLFYSRLWGTMAAEIWRAVPDTGTEGGCDLASKLLEMAQSPQEQALDGRKVQLNITGYHPRKTGAVVPHAGLLVEARGGFPGIDGWLYVELEGGEREIWLLQNTVAASHPINQGMREGVDLARVHDWADVPYRLVFVVPEYRLEMYRTNRQVAEKVRDEDRDACLARNIGRRPALVWKVDPLDLLQRSSRRHEESVD